MDRIHCLIFLVLILVICICCAFAQSNKLNCMDKAIQDISVNVLSDDPNKILNFVRDDPGYTKGLVCTWKLKASDYNMPRQMLLNVTNVDFDAKRVTREQCNSSAVDFFTFSFSGQLTKDQVRSKRWCSDSDVKNEPKLIMANLWNSSNTLTVEFKSDDTETRSNATGVEMDVLIMSENYCHKDMLFHNGSCHLITKDSLSLDQAQATAKSVLGNLAVFVSDPMAQKFLISNIERAKVFHFKPPFAPSSLVWTGCVMCKGEGILCADSTKNCTVERSSIAALCPTGVGRIAMNVTSDKPKFTCVNDTTKLPALIKFSQISSNVRYPFVTCALPTCRPDPTGPLTGPPTRPPTGPPTVPPGSTEKLGCQTSCIIGIAVASLAIIAVV